jgi:hypothetical protein
VALPHSVPGAASALPPASLLEIELTPNFVNLRNPVSLYFFPFLSLSVFILFVFTHARRYFFLRCLFQVCLKSGTAVFKGLRVVFRRLLSLSCNSIVCYRPVLHKRVFFITGLVEINLVKLFKS